MSEQGFNSPATIFTGVVLGTIGVLSFIVQPGLVQAFVTELNLTEATANQLAFDEMLGVAIATYGVVWAKHKFQWSSILFVALFAAAVGNLLSALLISKPEFISYPRFLAGLGEGAIICMSFTIVGLSSRTERNLAYYLVLLLSYGAIGLWIMPRANQAIGLSGIFIVWSLITFAALFLIRFVPTAITDTAQNHSQTGSQHKMLKWFALAGVLLFNLAIGITWANLFLIGMQIEPQEQLIANALLICQFIAIGGALIPVFMEQRLGLITPILLTIGGCMLAIILLLDSPNYTLFLVSVCLFNFLWNFGLPFILSGVGQLDGAADQSSGNMISLAIAMQMTGLGFGPFFAALLLGNDGNFYHVELLVITLFASSAVPLLTAILRNNKAPSLLTENN